MDGVRLLSVCCCGMAVVCTTADLPDPACVAYAIYSQCVLCEYCCHVVHRCLLGVWCSAACVSPHSFVWWGILRVPPLVVVVGGGLADGGVAWRRGVAWC